MPLIKSAKKALRASIAKKANNDITRGKIKSAVKGVKIAVKDGVKETTDLLSKAYRELDIAAKKNVIHKNKASRLKSRLTKLTTKVVEAPVEKAKKSPKKTTSKKK